MVAVVNVKYKRTHLWQHNKVFILPRNYKIMGFMSWYLPLSVTDNLTVESTESKNLEELDRFVPELIFIKC